MRLTTIFVLSFLVSVSFAMYRSSSSPDRLPDPSNILYPNMDSTYIVKILTEGEFYKSEVKYDANTMQWFALLGNGNTFFIKEQKLNLQVLFKKEGDKLKVAGSDSLKNILFMSGVELVPKEVVEMKLARKELGPGDRLEIEYNKKKYVILSEGQEAKERSAPGKAADKVILDYKIYIAEGSKEKNKTLLVHLRKLGNEKPQLVFMGDMDNDKKPDLIISIPDNDKTTNFCLFLSNHPPKGSLYKIEGVFKHLKP